MARTRKNIVILPEQARFIEEENINLSKFVQKALEEKMRGGLT